MLWGSIAQLLLNIPSWFLFLGAVIKLVSPQRQASFSFIQASKAPLCTCGGLFTFSVLSSTAWPRHERSPRRG